MRLNPPAPQLNIAFDEYGINFLDTVSAHASRESRHRA
jgi:hypothetical protein